MKDTPVIGIFVEKKTLEPVFKDRHYELAYTEIIESLTAKRAKAVILVGQSRYLGNGEFTEAWQPVRNGEEIHYERLGQTKVDIIFDKDHFIDDDTVPVINPKLLKEICENKHLSYEVLRDFHPTSSVAYTRQEFDEQLAALSGEIVVVKELHGSSGENVFVGPKAEVVKSTEKAGFPLQIQQFIETKNGIPGVADSRHDLRLLMLGNQPIIATLRTPPKDGFKSNLGYGGMNRLVDLAELPDELFEVAQRIDNILEQYAPFRLYSADLGLTPDGWRLFEVNGWPGVITQQRGQALAHAYQEKLTDYLLEMYKFYYHSKGS